MQLTHCPVAKTSKVVASVEAIVDQQWMHSMRLQAQVTGRPGCLEVADAVDLLVAKNMQSPAHLPGTAWHSPAQHSTAQHGTAWHSTARHSTARHSTSQLAQRRTA